MLERNPLKIDILLKVEGTVRLQASAEPFLASAQANLQKNLAHRKGNGPNRQGVNSFPCS